MQNSVGREWCHDGECPHAHSNDLVGAVREVGWDIIGLRSVRLADFIPLATTLIL